MQGIEIKMISVIAGDATLQSLMGGDGDVSSDPRVYWYYQGDAEVTSAKPAYITYAQLASPESSAGVGAPVYSMLVWGRDVDVVEQVRDRLETLFDKVTYTSPSPYSKAFYGRLIHEQDSFQEHSNFAGKTLHFRFGFDRTT